MDQPKTLFSRVGGTIQLRRVHKIFYDKLYAHEWLGRFFEGIDQEHIENQQTDFIAKTMGGPSAYYGTMPVPAHKHMMITDEMFTERARLLKDSLSEAGVPAEEAAAWLARDEAFRNRLVKKNLGQCKGRFKTDPILHFPKPPTRRVG